MCSLEIVPFADKTFGATVKGIDLSRPTYRTTQDTVIKAFYRYSTLYFPNQRMSIQAQMNVVRWFGEILSYGRHPHAIANYGLLPRFWHRDKPPNGRQDAGYSLNSLWPVSLPREHSSTELVDMTGALRRLPRRLYKKVEGQEHWCSQSFFNSVMTWRHSGPRTSEHISPPQLLPLVSHHPVTGRAFLNTDPAHGMRVPSLTRDKSHVLLNKLNAWSFSQPDLVYKHIWKKGDFLIFDNRCLLHRPGTEKLTRPYLRSLCSVRGKDDSQLYHQTVKVSSERRAEGLTFLQEEQRALAVKGAKGRLQKTRSFLYSPL